MKLFASPSVTTTAASTSSSSPAPTTPSSQASKDKPEIEEEVVKSFEELHVAKWLVESCLQMGIRKPTPIQAHCIPPLLSGQDVIGEAQTGSGKTAAFAVPILDILSRDPYGIFALVLTPTRELAGQIADQFRALGARMGARVQLMTGGMETVAQYTEAFSKPHVMIATPGRLCDFLETEPRAKMLFRNIKFVIYDEADRLLSPRETYPKFLRKIAQYLPEPGTGWCQYALFTATAAPLLKTFRKLQAAKQQQQQQCNGEEKEGNEVCSKKDKMSKKIFLPISTDAFVYSTAEEGVVGGTNLRKSEAVVVDSCTQRYVYLPPALKECYLVYLLRMFPAAQKQTIVFTATCKTAEYLHQMLETLAFKSVSLHSDLTQRERTNSLASFRSGLARIMISTDVASRGLDIQDVDLVINYDVPFATDDYVHRIGRTARAGRNGTSLIFVTPDNVAMFKRIEGGIGKTLEEQPIPEDDALTFLSETSKAKEISDMYLDTIEFDKKHEQKKMYVNGRDPNAPKYKKRKISKK